MKQAHKTLNTLNNNQHRVVAFNVDLPPDMPVQSYGVPRLQVEGPMGMATAVLVPAPTEGPGRFALDFIPAFGDAYGHVAVGIEIDVTLVGATEPVTLDRLIHFLVLRPEGDSISVTPQDPVYQDEAARAALAEAADEVLKVRLAAQMAQEQEGPARGPASEVEVAPSPQAPEPLTDEQRSAAAAVAQQAAPNEGMPPEQPQI